MTEFYCMPGDVLLYYTNPNLFNRIVQIGERLEDGRQACEFYHAAIALNAYEKVETNGGRVHILPIDYGAFVAFRPPYDTRKLPYALAWGRGQVGRLYGWIGILDQALRDISGGRVHLPAWFVRWANRQWPYCSTLSNSIMWRAGFKRGRRWPPPSPEDLWLAVKDYPVERVISD